MQIVIMKLNKYIHVERIHNIKICFAVFFLDSKLRYDEEI